MKNTHYKKEHLNANNHSSISQESLPNSRNDNQSDHPITQQFNMPRNSHIHWLNDLDTNNNTKECHNFSKEIADNSMANILQRLSNTNIPVKPNAFFTKKALTISRLKALRTHTKENEAHSREWAESLYRIDEKTFYDNLRQKSHYINYAIIAFAMLSIILSILDTELYIAYSQEYLGSINDAYAKEKNLTEITIDDYLHIKKRPLTDNENILRGFNVLSSLFLDIMIIVYYNLRLKILINEAKLSQYDTLASSGLLGKMIIDIVIGIICYPPKLHVVYQLKEGDSFSLLNLNCVINALSLIKLRFVFKLFHYFHRWNTKVSRAICKSYHVKHDLIFSVKCELKHRPMRTLLFFILITICLIGGMNRSYEFTALNMKTGLLGKKNINDLRVLLNNYWLIAGTLLGIGYGDYAPRTFTGRMLIFATSVFGVLVMCLWIVALSSYIELNQDEKKAYVKLTRLFHNDNKEHKASNVIRLLMKTRKLYMSNIDNKAKTTQSINEAFALLSLLITQSRLMKNDFVVANCYALPITDIIESMDHKITQSIKDFHSIVERLNDIETDIHLINENHNKAVMSLEKIDSMQKDVMKYMYEQFNRLYVRRERMKKQQIFAIERLKWKSFHNKKNDKDGRSVNTHDHREKTLKSNKTFKTSRTMPKKRNDNNEMDYIGSEKNIEIEKLFD